MDFAYKTYFAAAPSTGYETLLYDCMIGDATLFQRADNIEAGWRAVQPILDVWAEHAAQGFPQLCRGQRRSGGGRRAAGARRPRLAPARMSSPPEVPMAEKRKISLVLADVDGTLVNEEKVLTKRAQAAVQSLHRAGIRFAITSGRPPKGMAMLFDALQLETPIAGFNGGLFVKPRPLDPRAEDGARRRRRRQPIELIRDHGLDVWVYRGNDWLITKADAPHVAREAWTVKFEPKVVKDVARQARPGRQDRRRQRRSGQGAALRGRCQDGLRPARHGQPLAALLPRHHQQGRQQGRRAWNTCRSISACRPAEIATIGDQPTDVPMFKRSGIEHRHGQCPRRGQGSGQRHHRFLQRRRFRQGDGALHPGFVGVVSTGADTDRDALKRAAAEAAVELVQDGMVVGLGTGSTAAFAVEALARRHRQGLRFVGIPTSERTAAQAKAAGIPLSSFAEHRQIDLTIDGADEVERGTLNLIKGLGGALLREKIVASASRQLAIIVDGAKLVDRLGTQRPGAGRGRVPSVWKSTEARARGVRRGRPAAAVADGRACSSPTAATASSTAASPARSPIRRGSRSASAASSAWSRAASSSAVPIRSSSPTPAASIASTARAPIAARRRSWCSWGLGRRQDHRLPRNSRRVSVGPSRKATPFIPRPMSPRCMPAFPLTDADRQPWLERVAAWIDGQRTSRKARHHHLLRPEAVLSPDRRRRPAGSPAGLSARQPGDHRPAIWRGAAATSCRRACCRARSMRWRTAPEEARWTISACRPVDRRGDHPAARRRERYRPGSIMVAGVRARNRVSNPR